MLDNSIAAVSVPSNSVGSCQKLSRQRELNTDEHRLKSAVAGSRGGEIVVDGSVVDRTTADRTTDGHR